MNSKQALPNNSLLCKFPTEYQYNTVINLIKVGSAASILNQKIVTRNFSTQCRMRISNVCMNKTSIPLKIKHKFRKKKSFVKSPCN